MFTESLKKDKNLLLEEVEKYKVFLLYLENIKKLRK